MDTVIEIVKQNQVAAVATLALGAVVLVNILSTMLSGGKKASALNPAVFQPFKLVEKVVVSHDTRIFRFKLNSAEQKLGLPIGQHMYLKANVDGKDVQRAYTPISSDDELGYFELLIKVYFPNVHPKFPDGGKMTMHMERMKIGDSIDVRGPTGRFEYLGKGQYSQKVGKEHVKKNVKKIGMIAGGSGITPMYQVIKAILKDPSDKTEVYLLFCNQTESDILMRKDLEELGKDKRVHLWYTLDRPGPGWAYSEGFVNLEMIQKSMPGADEGSIVLMCGPPPMITYACKPNLTQHGYKDEQMFTF